MKSKYTWLLFIAIIGIGLIAVLKFTPTSPAGDPVTLLGTSVSPVPTPNPELVSQGESLYTQHCASCHGDNLEGKPDWKRIQEDGSYLPPPHDSSGHTWHHEDKILLTIIAKGGELPNSKMPAFSGILTEQEMKAVLEFIKSTWGQEEHEYQWWLTVQKQ